MSQCIPGGFDFVPTPLLSAWSRLQGLYGVVPRWHRNDGVTGTMEAVHGGTRVQASSTMLNLPGSAAIRHCQRPSTRQLHADLSWTVAPLSTSIVSYLDSRFTFSSLLAVHAVDTVLAPSPSWGFTTVPTTTMGDPTTRPTPSNTTTMLRYTDWANAHSLRYAACRVTSDCSDSYADQPR
jgi:hypothetical protein